MADVQALLHRIAALEEQVRVLTQERDAARRMCQMHIQHYADLCRVLGSQPTSAAAPINTLPPGFGQVSLAAPTCQTASGQVFQSVPTVPPAMGQVSLSVPTIPSAMGQVSLSAPTVPPATGQVSLSAPNTSSVSSKSAAAGSASTSSSDMPTTSGVSRRSHKSRREVSLSPSPPRRQKRSPSPEVELNTRSNLKGWNRVKMPHHNDLLVIADSMLKSLDPEFYRHRETEIFSFSGMRSCDLQEIVQHQFNIGVSAKSILLCVGTNDFLRVPVNIVADFLQDTIKLAKRMSQEVFLCNVPPSKWRSKQEDELLKQNNIRGFLNNQIAELCKHLHIRLFDLSHIMGGNREHPVKAFYHGDAIHPNTCGIIAIETCLRQILRGEEICPPVPDCVHAPETEVRRRRQLVEANYMKTTIKAKRLHSREDNLRRKRR